MWWLLIPLASASTDALLDERLAAAAPLRARRAAEGVPEIPAASYARVAAGETATGVVGAEGYAAKKAWGAAIVPHDIDTLWRALNDETHHPGYTQMGYSELVSGRICESGRRVLQYLPLGVPFVSDRWWITILDENAAITAASGGSVRELSWRSSTDPSPVTSDEGKKHVAAGVPLNFSKGGWFLVALDDRRTLLEYYAWSDPGGNLPASAATAFASSSIPKALDAISRYAADGKSHCR